MKKTFEPLIFIFFGLFHVHRIWGLIDREAYADFWLGVMEQKSFFYFLLMGVLGILCLWGIGIFFKNPRHNPWWRWIYILCGGYLLFDLFAIAAGFGFWRKLILNLYETSAPYWNVLWIAFILLGVFSLILGFGLMIANWNSDE